MNIITKKAKVEIRNVFEKRYCHETLFKKIDEKIEDIVIKVKSEYCIK